MFNFYKAIPDKTKKIISIILLVLLSVSINQYYGYRGINPIDSFFSFNAGYEVANGNFPLRCDQKYIFGQILKAIRL